MEITFKGKKYKSEIHFGTLRVHVGYKRNLKEVGELIQHLEQICIDNDYMMLVFDDSIVDFSDNNFIKTLGYKCLWDMMDSSFAEKVYPRNYVYGTWAKEITSNSIQPILDAFHTLKEIFPRIKKEKPTFEYKIEPTEVVFSYSGLENGKIKLQFAVKSLTVIDNEKEYNIPFGENFNETFSDTINKILEGVYKKQKIKNLFSPSKKYFETFFNKKITTNNEIQEKVYNELRKTKTIEEIEEFFAVLPSRKKFKKTTFDFSRGKYTLIFSLMEKHFIASVGEKEELFSYPTKKEAVEKFEEKSNILFQKELKAKIKNFETKEASK